MSGSRARAKAMLARALGIEADGVRETAAIGAQERWDSLAHLCLVVELEAVLERPLSAGELLEISSLDGIARVLAAAPTP